MAENWVAIAREFQVVKAAHLLTLERVFLARKSYVDLSIDDLIGAHIGHTEHQAGHTFAERDDRIACEAYAGRWAGKFRKHQPGN